MLRSCVLILSVLRAVAGLSFCFGSDDCYSVSYPFSGLPERPFAAVPFPIPLHWYLYTSDHPDLYQEISPENLKNSKFNSSQETSVIIHGFTENGLVPWVKSLCQEMFKVKQMNCISLDWSGGSSTFYAQAANLVRYVGRELGRFLHLLEGTHEYPASKVHLIGHSLGAQIAGIAGKHYKDIGRLTALDPAALYFEGADEIVRLTSKEAKFVDIIHSNGKSLQRLGLGCRGPIGQLDFYPNGGETMPECPDVTDIVAKVLCYLPAIMGPINCSESVLAMFDGCEDLVKNVTVTATELKESLSLVFCSHYKAIHYYIESVTNPEKFKAYPCSCLENCLQMRSEPCPAGGCQYMGYHAKPPTSPEPQMWTLSTT